MDEVRARFRGCLLGGAAANACGGKVQHEVGDSHLTLRTAEGLLLGWDDSDELGSACLVESVRRAYAEVAAPDRSDSLVGVAPVGLFMWRPDGAFSIRPAFALAAELAGLVDEDSASRLSAGALAAVVAALADGVALPGALAIARHLLQRYPGYEPVLQAINRAESHARAGTAPAQAIRELGAAGTPEQVLAIGTYCALVSESFEAGVSLAARHAPDAPAAAAVAGQLLGAVHGSDAIPAHWLEHLPSGANLIGVADRLATYWRGS